MRIDRSLKYLTIIVGVAACSAPADSTPPAAAAPVAAAPVAADPAPAPVAAPAPNVVVNLNWDSAPLDREYRAAKIELDARHAREISAPRAGETIVVRDRRHESENKALETRYERGKREHTRSLPPM